MLGLVSATTSAQPGAFPPAVSDRGNGAVTYLLLSGILGGVAGFRRLEAQLLEAGHRVVIIDPYALSFDSVDVTFSALARRVDRVLALRGVDTARVVGHAHGAGVALRLAANAPQRVTLLFFLDVGALPVNRTKVFSGALRLVPLITRMPGGRRFVRGRLLRGIRGNSGKTEWLDAETQQAYTEPLLDRIGRVVAMARRLGDAREPEPLDSVVARVRVPVTLLLGEVPHASGPDSSEIAALEPLGALRTVVRLPGVGHFPHEEAPSEVARLLLTPYGRPGTHPLPQPRGLHGESHVPATSLAPSPRAPLRGGARSRRTALRRRAGLASR